MNKHDLPPNGTYNVIKQGSFLNKVPQNMRYAVITGAIVFIAFIIIEATFSPLQRIRNFINPNAAVQAITVHVLENDIIDVFQMVTLEINSANVAIVDIIPGGFANPGTLTLIWNYDSTIRFGVRDAQQIRMRRIGDLIFVDDSSIQIEILEASVRNFEQTHHFRSNPLVSITPVVMRQIFEAQAEQETIASQRLINDRNLAQAKANFRSNFESIGRGLGITVIWE